MTKKTIAETRCSFCLLPPGNTKNNGLIANNEATKSICWNCVKKFTIQLEKELPIEKEPA